MLVNKNFQIKLLAARSLQFILNASSAYLVYVDGLVQERLNSIANTLELGLFFLALTHWYYV